jgi:hypothetical protein
MSSTESALRVLDWALEGEGPPPRGDPHAPEALVRPPAPLRAALGQLAAVTAARLRLGAPPLGDDRPLGAGGALMAAALALREIPGLAPLLLSVVPPADTPADWLARHGLVEPALPHLHPGEDAYWRQVSPLTALLDHPTESESGWLDAEALAVAVRLGARPDGRRALLMRLAEPTTSVPVRRWRGELLGRLRHGDPDFVLDVYEAAMVYHKEETLAQVRLARRVLSRPIGTAEEALQGAVATADWWGALWDVERENLDALRARRHLGYAYREGVTLFNLVRKRPRGD